MTELNNHKDRAHALLSASSAHRWLECPPSAVANEAYPDQETSFANEGTLAHEVAEAVASQRIRPTQIEVGHDAMGNPNGITHEMVECAKEYADYIDEQKKSNDAIVLLEQRVDFSPWVPDGFGTCDCIIIQDDTLTIIDYKYGQGVMVSATDNPQMKLYALGAMNDYGIAMDVQKVELHIFQPRMNNISTDSLTVEELMEWAEKTVKPAAEKAIKGKGKYAPGEHCRFCQHAGKCRALTKMCTEYLDTHGLRVALPVLAPYEVADVLRMEPMVTLWLKKVKEQALTTLMNGEELPGYKLVEGKLGNRKWRDDKTVLHILNGAGYDDAEVTETKVLSPSQMDKAIGKKKVAELLDEYIERAPGAPTIAPITDKRPALDRLAEAQKDFE
jgi:hypothetical protein